MIEIKTEEKQENVKPPPIEGHEDTPLEAASSEEEKLSEYKLKNLERAVGVQKKILQLNLKQKGFTFLIVCVIAWIVIYLIDLYIVNHELQNSSFSSGLVEFLKFASSTLIGFVFSQNINNGE